MTTSRFILFLAALYNICWGAIVSLYPEFILYDNPPTDYLLMMIQCIGMLVGVYGIAYYIASRDPIKYWPLVFVGLLGKVLGPIGTVFYLFMGKLNADFVVVNIFNDLIWIFPFTWIVIKAIKAELKENQLEVGQTLYQKFLGKSFSSMSPNLQEFHSPKGPAKVEGRFKVERGNSSLANYIASLAKLPKASASEEVELVVEPSNNEEKWMRRIGSHKVYSSQWLSGKFLVEKFGALRLYLCAEVNNGDLLIYESHSLLWGIPMPPFLNPKVKAIGRDVDNGVLVDVDIQLVPFGRLIRYHGIVRIKKGQHNYSPQNNKQSSVL